MILNTIILTFHELIPGEFCSRHRDAVDTYKYYCQSDARFVQFVRHCQSNPLLKKKGIPECILFVTQRLTKYPLLIEPLIKTSKDNKEEQEALLKAMNLVKEILTEVDAQVAEKEKEERKLEIYNRIDAKSYTIHRGHKFKKSDILQGNRSLKFEGVAMLMQGRGKMQIVTVVVLSDVLFFLQDNSHKYTFFTPDNKVRIYFTDCNLQTKKSVLINKICLPNQIPTRIKDLNTVNKLPLNSNKNYIEFSRQVWCHCKSYSWGKRPDRNRGEFI